jgi:hypothetical protein
MFLAVREKRFAKKIIKRLLKSHAIVSAERPDLSGTPLYRAVLLHSDKVDSSQVDKILQQSEDSVDLWTSSALEGFGFRQVVHFLVMSQYKAAGHVGAIVSFREIVYEQIPANM